MKFLDVILCDDKLYLGRQLRRSSQLPILLHVYRVIGVSRRFRFRLRPHTSRSASNRDSRLPRRAKNVAV